MTSNSADLDDGRIAQFGGGLASFTVRPNLYPHLRRFDCGEGEDRSEREVNEIVREYASGRYKDGIFRVTIDTHRLVGVAAFQAAKASHPDLGSFAGTPQIVVLGLSRQYRGQARAGRRLGDLILADALQAINARWRGTPDVLAQVNPKNTPARNLFERNGFRMIASGPSDGVADALFRRIGP
jgi:ribosomal protein S18 acetylase RimI-like enzyme